MSRFGPSPRSASERFWGYVQKTDGCWLWMATLDVCGYGRIYEKTPHGKRTWLAHRFSWVLHYGDIPDGMVACHRCDNPRCVNPSHLFLGTQADNMRDMKEKGRAHGRYEKTCCKYGHPYTSENVFQRKDSGRRECRECMRQRCRDRRAMLRHAA